MSYLERYLNGEHEAVWNELIAMGADIRNEPTFSDAKAVARETMQRTQRNIEKIYLRLKDMGYQFEAERSHPNPLDGISKQLREDGLLGSVFGGILGNVVDNLQSFSSGGDKPKNRKAYNPPKDKISAALDEYEKEIGLLPLSVRAWCEIVGEVDFRGDFPKLASYEQKNTNPFDIRGMMRGMMIGNPDLMQDLDKDIDLSDVNTPLPLNQFRNLMREEVASAKDSANTPQEKEIHWVTDPLYFDFEIDVDSAYEMIEAYEYYEYEREDDAKLAMMVAPDHLHKANISGDSYDILLPNQKADARLYGTDFYFVAYLRNSFAWAGFPMLADYRERDDELIARLKEGLEPI